MPDQGQKQGQEQDGMVVAVSLSPRHTMAKHAKAKIRLLQGLGVEGDAHAGRKVKHRSRVAKDPDQPNLRQVHLIHAELHDQLSQAGFEIVPGQMGENLTTRGLDLLSLPTGTQLRIGTGVAVEITGLRNPCSQLDGIAPGLMAATIERRPDGQVNRKAGVMAVVIAGGDVRPGDRIRVSMPPTPHRPLEPV